MSTKTTQTIVSIHAARKTGNALPWSVRAATLTDADAIVFLVNIAYRPSAGKRGWTHEADLVDGSRIEHVQMTELFARTDSVILIGCIDSRLIACVHVERIGLSSYIGMLAVHPEFQGHGIGSEMLNHAESYALSYFQSKRAVMTVIARRTELISFYLDRGYQSTGEYEAYPVSAGFGAPKVTDLNLSKLVKTLG